MRSRSAQDDVPRPCCQLHRQRSAREQLHDHGTDEPLDPVEPQWSRWQCRHWASLRQLDGVVGDGPLDVLRGPEVRGDGSRLLGQQRQHLRRERGGALVAGFGGRAAPGGGPHHRLVPARVPLEHRAVGGEDRVVGGHGARDDRLAEPGAGVDDDLVARPGDGVRGEHDSGPVRRHELLDDHCHGNGVVGKVEASTVGDGALTPEGGPTGPHRGGHGLGADDVEEGVLLPREGRTRQVLGRRTRPHGDRPPAEIPVTPLHRLANLVGEWACRDGLLRRMLQVCRR